ncbi:MAG: family N-acetyltransferase [Tardiphaga sp.]|uniref:GNAT family N-acetyltransferase n=1 Tax=Tardiphaga sp. TaxID=1926292 RepID=UPI0026316D98|nr:GNAT family N-acetyltransferase [Tardiphaga sp.]MDB5501651.1 family N-acetyltransferase [Tardiphaga sp.]
MSSVTAHFAAARGQVRTLTARELPLFREHLLRLDRESRRDRFNGSLDDDFLARYAEKCVQDGTIILAYFEHDMVRGAAELHQPDLSADSLPEIAFSVESSVRRQGVGSILFTKLIAKARSMGYRSLRITTGAQNDAMRALANKFGARLSFRHGESTGNIDLTEAPTPGVVAQPKTAALDVARAVTDYNRAYWGLWFKLYGMIKPS